jgi:hypothetical protein
MYIYKRGASTLPKPPEKDDKSSIAGYAAWFLRQEYFPCIASDGAVYTKAAGTTGAASAKARKFFTDPAALTQHLKENFPQGCISIAGPPRLRASEYKKIGKTMQSTLSFAPTGGILGGG